MFFLPLINLLRILVWEDGFCNFAASAIEQACGTSSTSGGYGEGGGEARETKGLQPELFFKMSHEIYNYGEGCIIIKLISQLN